MRPDTYNILIQYIVGNEITTYPVDFIVLFESSSYIIDDEDIKYSFEYSEGNLESLTQIPEATGIMK
jgi:hypothetical protein